MKWLWNASGAFFGFRDGDDLWTYEGRHIGRFHGHEVYRPDGSYLGEVLKDESLVSDLAKSGLTKPSFRELAPRGGISAEHIGAIRLELSDGYVDFPPVERFPSPR